jgi:enoyl-CoA hydratase
MPIHFDKTDHIVTITMDRHEKRNAMDIEHGHALAAAWKQFNEDDDAWVAIITGVKNSFCAGGDLNSLNSIAEKSRETGDSSTYKSVAGPDGIRWSLKNYQIDKPIIAAVNGFCVAGGFEMLGATDIRIASTEAVFQIPEPKRGLIAMGGTTARLPRQLPWPLAMELLLTADRIDAHRAREIGLVNEVVEPDQLLDTALAWARRITVNAPLAVQGTKRSAYLGIRTTLEDAFALEEEIGARNFLAEDAAEGSRAFVEKRPPVWRGR